MSSPEELRSITQQFKHNTEDLQTYLRDLNNWEEEMQSKDEHLKAKKRASSHHIAEIGDKKKAEPAPIVQAPPAPKEQDSIHVAPHEAGPVPKDMKVEQLMQKAMVEKEKGNDYFKRGQYDLAIEHYSRGMQCHATNPMLPANRAMAFLKVNKCQEAEDDCTLALALDPTYVKAYLRRATARLTMKKTAQAAEDLNQVLKIDPKNKQAKADLEKALQEPIPSPSSQPPLSSSSSSTFPSFGDNMKKAFASNAGPKFEELADDDLTDSDAVLKPSSKSRTMLPPQNVNIAKGYGSKSSRLDMDTSHESVLKSLKINEYDEVEDDPKKEAKAAPGFVQDISARVREGNQSTSTLMTPVSSKKTISDPSDTSGLQAKRRFKDELKEPVKPIIIHKPIPEKPKVKPIKVDVQVDLKPIPVAKPKSSVQFYSDWRRHSPEKRVEYLQLFRAQDYSLIFKHSLEPSVFTDILKTLQSMDDQHQVGPHLLGLAQVARISALIMFLATDEKSIVEELIAKMNTEKSLSEKDKQKVISTLM